MTEIEGVHVTPLRRIPDERGAILHMMREDGERFGRQKSAVSPPPHRSKWLSVRRPISAFQTAINSEGGTT